MTQLRARQGASLQAGSRKALYLLGFLDGRDIRLTRGPALRRLRHEWFAGSCVRRATEMLSSSETVFKDALLPFGFLGLHTSS